MPDEEKKEYQMHYLEKVTINVARLMEDRFILDIGGGGEGVIGAINGDKVISIDLLKSELIETNNDSLKIVMDATDLSFLDKTFNAVTAFYSLMYIPEKKKEKVFEEAYRVLKDNTKLYLWDSVISGDDAEGKEIIVIPCEINTGVNVINTGYGIKWKEREQDKKDIIKMAINAGFKVYDDRSRGKIIEVIFLK